MSRTPEEPISPVLIDQLARLPIATLFPSPIGSILCETQMPWFKGACKSAETTLN